MLSFEVPLPKLSVSLAGPQQANSIANHPDVFPLVALDERPIAIGGEARVYDGDGCSFVFFKQAPGTWHLHTLSLPNARGRNLLHAAKSAAFALFTETDCGELFTITPKDNLGARPPKSFGFELWFEREEWASRMGNPVGAEFYALSMDRWILKSAWLRALGKWFHDILDEAKQTMDASVPSHKDDPAHDAYVGAALAMSGQPYKACAVFNRFARFAGYHPLEQIEADTFFTGDAVIRVRGARMEILGCL